MDCILFRHGISVPCENWTGPERERPLTKEGVSKTRKALVGLKQLNTQPSHLLSSPFTRAMQTAQIAVETFPESPEIRVCQELVFDSPPAKLFRVLAGIPEESFVICVGHEPHLGHTAALMIFGKVSPGLSLKKAGACCIGFDGVPKLGQGVLKWWLTPSQLRQLKKKS